MKFFRNLKFNRKRGKYRTSAALIDLESNMIDENKDPVRMTI